MGKATEDNKIYIVGLIKYRNTPIFRQLVDGLNDILKWYAIIY